MDSSSQQIPKSRLRISMRWRGDRRRVRWCSGCPCCATPPEGRPAIHTPNCAFRLTSESLCRRPAFRAFMSATSFPVTPLTLQPPLPIPHTKHAQDTMAFFAQQRLVLLLVATCLLLASTTTHAFLAPVGRMPTLHARASLSTQQQQHQMQQLAASPSSTRRRDLLKMEVDPAVIGGVIAGVVGVSLGVGAMIFTEKQTVRREERKAADKAKAARAQRAQAAASAAASATAQSSEAAPQGGKGGSTEDEDGW